MISARIILDSINPANRRITTWLLTYPRFIHSEFMTHRIFSRNAASSRAIPIERMIEAIRKQPATFEQVGRANKGMSAQDVCPEEEARFFNESWVEEFKQAANFAYNWSDHIAKQVVNRILEPWAHMTVLATATDHSNFFSLRADPAAQPEFQVLAYRMLAEYLKSTPRQLGWGEWHLPGVKVNEGFSSVDEALRVCTARAMRTSYSKFDEELTIEKAYELHDKGRASGHWSPFEHCAQAISVEEKIMGIFHYYPWSNFDSYDPILPSGWGQYRKYFENENRTNVDLAEILIRKPSWVTL